MKSVFVYIIYSIISALGLSLLKISKFQFNLIFLLGTTLYVIGFLLWLFILKTNDLSIAFPVASSLLIIATQLLGVFLLGEEIRISKIIGVLLITIGILTIYGGSNQ